MTNAKCKTPRGADRVPVTAVSMSLRAYAELACSRIQRNCGVHRQEIRAIKKELQLTKSLQKKLALSRA